MLDLHKTQIDRMVNELTKRGEHSRNKALFIRHYDAYCIDADYVKNIMKDADFTYFAHEFSLEDIQPAYEPFLNWIKELYEQSGEESPRSFLEKCQVYPLHYDIFESYFETGEASRWEDILLHEIKYEQKRMMDNMIQILKYASKKRPIFMLLNRIHFAQNSTLRFLHALLQELKECSIYILGAYNEEYKVRQYLVDEWEQFTDLIDKQRFVVSWVSQENSEEYYDSDFVPEDDKLDHYITKLQNMVEFGAYAQANYYLFFIFQKYQNHIEDIGVERWIKICLLYLRNCVYLNDVSNAIRVGNRIKDTIFLVKDREPKMFMVAYYIGMAQVYNRRPEIASQCVEQCKNILEKCNDEVFKMRMLILKDVNIYKGFDAQNMDDDPKVVDQTLIELLKKYNFRNHLAYLYTNCLENYFNSIRYESPNDNGYYREGLRIAKEIGNDNCTIIFYINRVVLASSLGRYELPEVYYKKILPLVEKGQSLRDLCNTYNGMGYFTCVGGSYEKSDDYFNQALRLSYDIKDTKLVAETLYNKCVTAFMAKDYKNAIRYIEFSIDIVEEMGYMSFIVNWSKLYGLAALANYYDNNGYSCNFHFEKMKRFLAHLIRTTDESKFAFWDDDLFLYYLLNGMIEKSAENYTVALEEFKLAKKHLVRTPGFHFFGYPIWAKEMVQIFEEMHLQSEAKEVLAETIEVLKEKNYLAEIEELEAMLYHKEFVQKVYSFPLDKELSVELKSLCNEAAIKRANKMFRSNSEFLVVWQNVLAEKKSLSEICENALSVTMNHFGVDQLFIFSRGKEKLELFISSNKRSFSSKELAIIEKFAKNYPNGFVVSRLEKEFYVFKEVLGIFDLGNVVSFMMVPYLRGGVVEGVALAYIVMKENLRMNGYVLSADGLTIFKATYRQLVDLVEKEKASEMVHTMNEKLLAANKKLEEIAIKDALTGIYNRQGLSTTVEELEKEGNGSCAILYFDLDNFKYYNDTFGHDIGDLILIRLARILRDLAPENGIPIRYGGDEFLLLVPNEGEETGVILAKKFYKILDEDQYFVPDIEEKIGRKVTIPEEKLISSSIGIAAADKEARCDMAGAIMHADEALYRIKKTTKKDYITWTRIAFGDV